MITENDAVELKGTIAALGTDSLDVSITEIYLDAKWKTLTPAKTYTILTSEYTDAFSTSELAVIKELTDKNKAATIYTPDQLQAINSILKKLTTP